MKTQGIFITGTDTGVGKTHVTALLLRELQRRKLSAAAFKPIACGPGGRDDARLYQALLDDPFLPLEVINPVYLRHPLAPSVAAKLERRTIDLVFLRLCFRFLAASHQVVLVEGAGGLLVPIRRNYFVADLARDLGLPVVIVGRLGLGTINHCLLTVRQAQASGLKVKGIILNDLHGGRPSLAERTNPATVRELCRVPLLGVVPHSGHTAAATGAQRQAARRIGRQLFGPQ